MFAIPVDMSSGGGVWKEMEEIEENDKESPVSSSSSNKTEGAGEEEPLAISRIERADA